MDAGLKVVATGHTFELIRDAGLPVEKINKMQEGRPNILDAISNGEIQLIINTPAAPERKFDDSYIRKSAIKAKIPYVTTIAAAKATASGIKTVKLNGKIQVESLQERHRQITDY